MLIRPGANQGFGFPFAGPQAQAPGDTGAGGYVAKAVHFDGATWLVNSALTATDSDFFSFMYWFKNDTGGTGDGSNLNAGLTFVVDSENNYTTYLDNLLSGTTVRVSLENEAGSKGVNTDVPIWISDSQPIPTDTNWHQLIFTGQTGQASPNNICKAFVDGVDIGVIPGDQGPFQMVFNGKSFWFGADSFGGGRGSSIVGDIADAWIAPGTSLLTGSTISAETLALFRDPITGKPTDPSGFPSGGVILFSGDANTFATNKGTGGAFTLTGTLTNATTSPSE